MNIFKLIYRLFTCQSYKENKRRKEEYNKNEIQRIWDEWLDDNVKV